MRAIFEKTLHLYDPMKTNPSARIFKLSTLALLGIGIAAALVTQPVRADGIVNNVVITENSSTSLGVTYTLANGTTEGVTVSFQGTDNWIIILPTTVRFNGTAETNWIEPENSSENVFTGAPNSNAGGVRSDVVPIVWAVKDGITVDDIGTDISNGGTINMTFFDKAASAEGHAVPDTGSTFDLLFLALAALLGATRLRSLRLA